ncbi:hypothetical protein G3A_17455 [Bacillus sp. 17376]|uniref:Uncharacterized protein n=1 Tax=Mesobacillus boroniphilus JCM 21738 TaxID=1294265 RepID=W4RUZ9_9BACI|nr:hypothetical protein [Mesobacillus boroniphilus]ESU31295.1 hypothetical protein G3A_17455 [Bacillus sp. 17376]GAE48136.1 hypothetical protein JCM21738_5217 [Mesobacillus boroniphilus JCM 21738]
MLKKGRFAIFIVAFTLLLSSVNVIAGVSGAVNAKEKEKVNPRDYSGKQIETMFEEVEPFITLTENETVGVIDSKAAKKAGVSKESINLANYYLDKQNAMLKSTENNESIDAFMSEFNHYFMYITEGTEVSREPGNETLEVQSLRDRNTEEIAFENASLEYINSKIDLVMDYVSFDKNHIATLDKTAAEKAGVSAHTIDIAEKAFQEQNENIRSTEVPTEDKSVEGIISALASGGCGGSTDNPHKCPPRDNVLYRVSLGYGQDYLLDRGYHETSWYAGGSAPWRTGRDYTKKVSAYNCVYGAFRYQGLLSDGGRNDGYVSVIIQVPEPNPELHTYDDPSWTWAYYVRWWHYEYC